MIAALADDFNTVEMFGILFENLTSLTHDLPQLHQIKDFLKSVCGLSLEPIIQKTIEITPEIQQLLDERNRARQEKNWDLADKLRKKLEELGVLIQDKKLNE